MKIAFLSDGAYAYASRAHSVIGGTERDIWLLARALAAAGWSAIVGVREALADGEHCTIDGVRYVGIGQGHILRAWYKFLSSEQPEWLFWQDADHMWGPAVEIAKHAGVRTIFSAASDGDVRPRCALFRRRRWWPLYAWGLLRTDKIFVQHGGQLAELAPQWRAKASILPKVCIPASSIAETVTVKPHAERAQYVAWVAMLRQPKRPDVLIEIARQLPAIRFIVCGGPTPYMSPPGYGEWIVDALRAEPNIDFLGKVAPHKALEVIANASIFLSTSDIEGFPSTFLEAWSVGTPVISFKIDPDRIIQRKKLGAVLDNVKGAVSHIKAFMGSPQQREEIAVRARRYVAEAHSAAAVTTALECAIKR